jgi:hypothetical protein
MLFANLSKFRFLGFPLGRLMFRSELSDDPITRNAVNEFAPATSNRGGLVMDAHPGLLDLFASLIAISHFAQAKAVCVPLAASFYYHPFLFKFLFHPLDKYLKLHPVFRKEEKNYTSRYFYNFSGFSMQEMEKNNRDYLSLASKTLKTKNSLVMLAPYGGRSIHEEWIRSGVLNLIKKNTPIIFTVAKFSLKKFRFIVFAQFAHDFNQLSWGQIPNSKESLSRICKSTFKELLDRADKAAHFQDHSFGLLAKISHYIINGKFANK